MNTPPLQLHETFFTKVSVEPRFEVSAKDVRPLQTRVDFIDGSKPGEMLVRLGVRKGADSCEDKNAYIFELEICGIFSADSALFAKDSEKAMSYVRVNGTSILYSSVREIVSILTSRGPFGTYTIPAVSFLNYANPQKKQQQQVPEKP